LTVYNDEGTDVIGQGSIVIRADNEREARIRFVNMLPITGHWMLKIDFVLECDVWWDHMDETD
jgi:hypothetical protein